MKGSLPQDSDSVPDHGRAERMENEPTKEEVERRARELARRVMDTPPQPHDRPKKPKAPKETGGASKPGRRAPVGEAS